MRHGIRQNELAELIGYEQTYISALEVGLKGPPTPEFVDKLVTKPQLAPVEVEEIRTATKASDRKLAAFACSTSSMTSIGKAWEAR